MSEWQDISTAPKDGRELLLVVRRVDVDAWTAAGVPASEAPLLPPEVIIGSWSSWLGPGDEEWHGHSPRRADGGRSLERLTHPWFPTMGPTHWMPLPAPPERTPVDADAQRESISRHNISTGDPRLD